MGERRVPGVVSQKTLGEVPSSMPPLTPPEPPPTAAPPPPPPEPPPRPVLYPAVAPSSGALHERQLRWLRERERHAAAARDPPAKSET
jgi:hypothetical protein